jgi:hypothetical protein
MNQSESTTTTTTTTTTTAGHMFSRENIVNIDTSHLIVPLSTVMLTICWYFRVNFKHFFSPLSTLFLLISTFAYFLFLINNINTVSFLSSQSRLIRRRYNPMPRLRRMQQQISIVRPTPTTTNQRLDN